MLKPVLKNLPLILRDSDHLIKMIRGKRFPITSRVVQLDIEDFFMSGSHSDLANSCSSLVANEKRKGFKNMLQVILRNQYVMLKKNAETAYYTRVGNGMGMCEISNACFYDLVERCWACDKIVCARYGVLFYARFKDDSFFVVDGHSEA